MDHIIKNDLHAKQAVKEYNILNEKCVELQATKTKISCTFASMSIMLATTSRRAWKLHVVPLLLADASLHVTT